MKSDKMVAVLATQAGARQNRFDEHRFLEEVVKPVKEFLEVTRGSCPVLLFFFAGSEPNCEEGLQVPLPEENVALATPSYCAAEKYFVYEFKVGRVWMHALADTEVTTYEKVIEKLMRDRGVKDPRILPVAQLSELADELSLEAV